MMDIDISQHDSPYISQHNRFLYDDCQAKAGNYHDHEQDDGRNEHSHGDSLHGIVGYHGMSLVGHLAREIDPLVAIFLSPGHAGSLVQLVPDRKSTRLNSS